MIVKSFLSQDDLVAFLILNKNGNCILIFDSPSDFNVYPYT